MTRTYPITECCQEVADVLSGMQDQSVTTIRCAINDALDAAHKDGCKVNFNFNQDWAVKRVQRLIGK